MATATKVGLRDPFPASEIGKLPRLTCRDCSDSRSRVCEKHTKTRCQVCANYLSTAHMHLDYVGHAETTDRLLTVDPGWTWEPLGVDERGLPAFDAIGGLWIRLTVGGVSRLGYGHAGDKRGGDAIKEAIGDAIRNAAMRFGVALDLWRKTERADAEHPERAAEDAARAPMHVDAAKLTRSKGAPPGDDPWQTPDPVETKRAAAIEYGKAHYDTPQVFAAAFELHAGEGALVATATEAQLDAFLAAVGVAQEPPS